MIMKFPYKTIDLTHILDDKIPSWDMDCGYKVATKLDYNACQSDVKFRVQSVQMNAGIGTHIDAPAHCIPGSMTVDQLPLEKLFIEAVCINVSDKMSADYKVCIEDLNNFEKQYGIIPKSSFVIFYTGWSQFWNKAEKYHNDYQFPTVCKEVAELLVERGTVGLGIDTLSPDSPTSGFPVHDILLRSGIYIVENVAYADRMPAKGGYVSIMPFKGKDLTEAPVRMIGLLASDCI